MNETSLEQMLQKGQPVAPSLAMSILWACVRALDNSHSVGQPYKYLTPANVVLFSTPRYDVEAEFRLPLSDAEPMFGLKTPPFASYMSPEEVLGTAPDARSEEFSLGTIAYQLLTGTKPFRAGSVSSLFYEICTQDPAPANQANSKLNGSTAAALGRALAKDPAERFQTPAEFVQSLDETFAIAEPAPIPTEAPLPEPVVAQPAAAPPPLPQPAPPPAAAAPLPFELPPARRRRAYEDPEPETRRSGRPLSAVQKVGLIAICCAAVLAVAVRLTHWRPKPDVPVQVLDTKTGPISPPPPQQPQEQSAPVPTQTAPPSEPAPEARATPPDTAAPAPETDRAEEQPRNREQPSQQPLTAPTTEAPATPPPTNRNLQGSGSGSVELLTEPPGAQMQIDHRPEMLCISPCTVMLPPGRHVLSASLNGFTTAQRIFHVPDDSSLLVTLTQGQGALLVTSAPAGALIMLDGKEVGRTPLSLHVRAGTHQLSGFYRDKVKQQTVTVQPDGIQGASFDLR